MKNENHNPVDSETNRHYKKRYLVRKIEEAEAEKERRSFQMPEHDQLELFPDRDE